MIVVLSNSLNGEPITKDLRQGGKFGICEKITITTITTWSYLLQVHFELLWVQQVHLSQVDWKRSYGGARIFVQLSRGDEGGPGKRPYDSLASDHRWCLSFIPTLRLYRRSANQKSVVMNFVQVALFTIFDIKRSESQSTYVCFYSS